MSAITIRLAWPPRQLSPNFRPKHWSEVSTAKREYRFACKVDSMNAKDCRTIYPLCGPLEGHATFITNTKNRHDTDNLLASLKAGMDGVADAGVIANDRDIASWQVSVERGVKREVVVILKEREG